MPHFLTAHRWLIASIAGTSAIMFVATLIALPIVIIKLRPDYFLAERRRHPHWRGSFPVVYLVLIGLKNLLGAIFIFCGLVMLLTPGQGLLSILIGMTMMNYPGKFRFERWLASRPHIWRILNWIRCKAHAPPLTVATT